jgi:hypothetical protein
MQAKRSLPGKAVLIGVALGASGWSTGCGQPGSSRGTAAAISPEMKKKTDDKLKDYAQRAAERAKAQQRAKDP